jgi:sugar lactone lactonase YvrE
MTTSGAITLLTSTAGVGNQSCIDASGNLYTVDYNGGGGGLIFKYTVSTNTSAIIAGNNTVGTTDGLGTAATFSTSAEGALVADPSGNIYVADLGRVRKLTLVSGEGGILPLDNSLYTSNFTTALTVQAPLSYRYVTSNVSGTTVDLTASSNRVGTTYRLTAGPSNTLTFPALSASTSGSWWTFSNAYSAAQTLTLAGTTTGLTSPYSLPSNSSLTVYSDGSSYRIVTSGAVPNTIGGVTLSNGQVGGVTLSGGAITNASSVNGVPATPTIYNVTTFVGNGSSSETDGTGTGAAIAYPFQMVFDSVGNMYVCTAARIRKITPAGVITTLAGSGSFSHADGTGTNASFNGCLGLAIDNAGTLYSADGWPGSRIRMITPAGVVTTLAGNGNQGFADGTGTNAIFGYPESLATDNLGNLYITARDNVRIRKLVIATGVVTTLAGNGSAGFTDGTGTNATLTYPHGLAYDSSTNTLVFTDAGRVRRVTFAGVVTTIAASREDASSVDGTGSNATFYGLTGCSVDSAGNIYVAEQLAYKVRKVTPAGVVTTLAGNSSINSSANGLGTAATFGQVIQTAVDSAGIVYATDHNNYIRKLTPLSGSGGILPFENSLYTADMTTALTVRAPLSYRYSTSNVAGTTVDLTASSNRVGTTYRLTAGPSNTLTFPSLSASTSGSWWTFSNAYSAAQTLTLAGTTTGLTSPISLSSNTTVTIYSDGSSYRTVTGAAVPNTIGGVTLSNGQVGGVTLSGGAITNASSVNGVPATPTLYNVTTITTSVGGGLAYGAAYDTSTGNYYVGYNNGRVYKITQAGVVTTLAGNATSASVDGTGTNASFVYIRDMVCDSVGNIYISDSAGYNGSAIRKVTPAGVVTTLAGNPALGPAVVDGTGTNARFSQYVYGITVDPTATYLYIADWTGSSVLRRLDLSTNAVTSITPTPAANFGYPRWDVTTGTMILIAYGSSGTMYRSTITGSITSLAVLGTSSLSTACIDSVGNIFATDGNKIVKYTTSTGTIAIIAGSPVDTSGSVDGLGTAATFGFFGQGGIVADPSGNIYVADNGRVRKLTSLSGEGGILPFENSLYTSNFTTALTVQAPLSYRYVTSNVSGTTVDLTASSNRVGTTYRLTAGPSNTLTFPALSASTSGSWWEFSNAYSAAQTLTLAGTTTGLSSPVSLLPSTTVTIYSDGANYYIGSGPVTLGNLAVSGGNISNATSLSTIPVVSTATVTTFAGSIGGSGGNSNATGTNALFNFPTGSCVDPSGNVYIADNTNNILRRITPAGVVTTFAGSGTALVTDGTGTSAAFKYIYSVAYDPTNGTLIVGEVGAVRRVTLAGVVTTIAGGPNTGSTNATGTNASFNQIFGVVVDPATGNIYCAEQQHVIRQVTPAGVVTLLAGSFGSYTFSDGVGTNARFYSPWHITTDGIGNLYVADYYNYRVRKIVIATATVTTVAGNNNSSDVAGTGTNASFSWCVGMAYDSVSGLLYTSTLGGKVISVSPTTGVTSFFVGSSRSITTDGVGTGASLGFASSICLIPGSTMYFTDRDRNNVRKVTLQPYFGGLSVSNNALNGVTLSNGDIRTLSSINNVTMTQDRYVVTTFAGNGSASDVNGVGTNASIIQPEGIHYSALMNTFYTSSRSGAVRMIDPNGNVTTLASGLGGGLREGITTDRSGNVYVVNANTFNTVGRITPNGVVTVFAGSGATASTDGTGTNAAFNNPYGIVCDPTGTFLYVSDASTHKIRRIVISSGVVTTIAGSGGSGSTDGVGTNASFSTPTGLAIDSTGDVLYICSSGRLRRLILSAGVVTTVAGNGSVAYTDGTGTNAALFANKVIVDPVTGNLFAVGNFGGHNPIRMITPAGVVTTIAGGPADGFADGVGTDAVFSTPISITVDTNGILYVADNLNHRIRKITSTARVGGVLLTNGTLTTSGTISVQQIQETLNTIASPGSGTVVANWSTGNIWYVSSMSANFTINLTNLPTVANKSYSVVFTLVQGATPYYISALQIAGVAQTIKWSGGSAPTATANRVELETFTLMYTGSAWTVLGQLTTFG